MNRIPYLEAAIVLPRVVLMAGGKGWGLIFATKATMPSETGLSHFTGFILNNNIGTNGTT